MSETKDDSEGGKADSTSLSMLAVKALGRKGTHRKGERERREGSGDGTVIHMWEISQYHDFVC